MMSIEHRPSVEAMDSLATVAGLLNRAADMAWDRAVADPDALTVGLAFGAQLAGSQALDLLPTIHFVERPGPVETDPVKLLRAAEELTRLHPIEEFPPGTSQLIVAICDLLREHAP